MKISRIKEINNRTNQEFTKILYFGTFFNSCSRAVGVIECIVILPYTKHVGHVTVFISRFCYRFKEGSEVIGNKHSIEVFNCVIHELTNLFKLKLRALLQFDVIYELLNVIII